MTTDKRRKRSAGDPDAGGIEWVVEDGRILPRAAAPPLVVDVRGAAAGRRRAAFASDGSSPCLREGDDYDVLCEGDSWFCLSVYGPGHVTMAQKLSGLGYAVCNVAKYSRSSSAVQERKRSPNGYLTRLAAKPKAFMLSSGGIDFLGDTVRAWLLQRASGDHDPANAPRYVSDEFQLILNLVRLNYRRVIADVKARSPETVLIFQTYGYAEPTHVEGPFLGRHFDHRGFDVLSPYHRPLIRAIIRHVIDRFRAMLADLKDDGGLDIRIVDYREMLGPDDFRDEIHPKTGLAARMAQPYIDILDGIGVDPRALTS